jgi:hypothetical protein
LLAPCWRIVFPVSEVLSEQIGPYGLEVVAKQIAQAETLLADEIAWRLGTHHRVFSSTRPVAVLGWAAGLGGPDIVKA